MSINTELSRIKEAKADLKTAINAKTDDGHKITNETIDDYASFVDSIQTGGGIPSEVAIALKTMVDRQGVVDKIIFEYDNKPYWLLDLSVLDETEYRITNLGQRAINSFAGGNYSFIVKMPAYLESINGANWTSTTFQYYNFSGYKGDTVPTLSNNISIGNSGKILVPNRLLSAWKTATNWSGYSASQYIGVDREY